jgi:hypothetical protein
MSRLSKTLTWMEAHPEYLIQGFLAVALLITGVYIAGPWYVGGSTTAIGVLSDSSIGHIVIGTSYMTTGAVGLYGVVRNSARGRYWGTMLMFGAFFFMVLLRLLTIGFTPIIWVLILALAFTAGVLHIIESRRREKRGG